MDRSGQRSSLTQRQRVYFLKIQIPQTVLLCDDRVQHYPCYGIQFQWNYFGLENSDPYLLYLVPPYETFST